MGTFIVTLYISAFVWAAVEMSIDVARWVRKEFIWRRLRNVDLTLPGFILPEQRNRLRILGQVRMAGMPGALVL